jgi:acyl carrier protein
VHASAPHRLVRGDLVSRDEVMDKVRAHLASELQVDPDRIQEDTRFRDDLDADSLDLYELVMELEDVYGVKLSEEEAARIETVGQAVDFVLDRVPSA